MHNLENTGKTKNVYNYQYSCVFDVLSSSLHTGWAQSRFTVVNQQKSLSLC